MERYQRHPNTTCSVCKKAVYKRPGILEKNNGRAFCGLHCYGISLRKEVPCVNCGKLMLSGLNKKTCSRACANQQRAGIHYKIGRPRDKVVLERSMKIRLFSRSQVCERCGYDKREILQVHHKDGNHGNNDIYNLELICPNCHCEEHYLDTSWLKNRNRN